MKICRILLLLASIPAFSALAAEVPSPSAVGIELPSKVRALLIQEMNAILAAAHDILDALIRGEDAIVADRAQAIHDRFIMHEQMTAADREALHHAVPDAFLERDRAFHRLSAQLAEAARRGDRDGQQRLFAEMIEACTGCHSRYAIDRFPGFGDGG